MPRTWIQPPTPTTSFKEAAACRREDPARTSARHARDLDVASMRPRLRAAEDYRRHRRVNDGYLASMRPRHECRGRSAPLAGMLLSGGRFNEAAARMPRKIRPVAPIPSAKSVASMRPRHECRGRSEDWTANSACLSASMRPRHECRGRSGPLAEPAASSSFNEAAARMPRKSRLGVEALRAPSSFNEAAARRRGRSRSARGMWRVILRFNEAAARHRGR